MPNEKCGGFSLPCESPRIHNNNMYPYTLCIKYRYNHIMCFMALPSFAGTRNGDVAPPSTIHHNNITMLHIFSTRTSSRSSSVGQGTYNIFSNPRLFCPAARSVIT